MFISLTITNRRIVTDYNPRNSYANLVFIVMATRISSAYYTMVECYRPSNISSGIQQNIISYHFLESDGVRYEVGIAGKEL